MNIKKALKEKKKLAQKLVSTFSTVQTYNTHEEDTTPPYSPKETLDEYIKTVNEMIELKTKIHKANIVVYDKIFRLSEYKSIVSQLRRLTCFSGKESNRYGTENRSILVSDISILERDNLITHYENEIERLQDELDAHNSITEIK
jgi:hypothetical protein